MAVSNATTLGFTTAANDVDFDSLLLVRIVHWVWAICLPIMFALGLFGNVMNIIILRRFQANRSALDRYFLCLAVTDLCVNVTGPLRDWILTVTDFRPFGVHDVVCKTAFFIQNTAVACSAWFVVLMVSHRAVSVVWPHRVNVICTPHRSWGSIVFIVIFFSCAYSHFFYGMEVSGKECVFKKDYLKFLIEVFGYIDILLYSVMPFLCLMVSNVVLVVKLRTLVKEAGDQFTTTDEQQSSRERKVNSITLTALVVSVSFIVFTLPLALKNMIDFTFLHGSEVKDINELASDFFLQNLFFCVAYSNFSLNFYLYCLTGQRFRSEFKAVMSGLFVCVKSPKQ